MVKLLVNGMLGSLAKWLRILGYDTAYFSQIGDNELARIARAEERILLTRDRELAKREGLNCLLIESDELEEQVRQAIEGLGLTLDRPFSRCPICNTPLKEIGKEEVKDRVPVYIFQTHKHFRFCPKCEKPYWRGTHWDKMKETIEKFKR
jgi:hypothetical protein